MFLYCTFLICVQSELLHSHASHNPLFIKLTLSEMHNFGPTSIRPRPLLLLDEIDTDDQKLPSFNDLQTVFLLRRYYQEIQSFH